MFKYGCAKIIKMLDVDCRDIKPIMRDLLVYVSDQVGAIPAIKSRGFALESFDEDGMDSSLVIRSIREYLVSVGEDKKYAITAQGKTITIRSISGEQMKPVKNESTDAGLFSCTHCGYVTRYETDLKAHRVIHYL